MSTTPSPDRRFIIALTAAVASATLAVGVTAGALLGWVGPPRRTSPVSPWPTPVRVPTIATIAAASMSA